MSKFRKLYFKFLIFSRLRGWHFDAGHGPRCFIFLAADYGNLGDVAITFAQRKFLMDNFPQHKVIEIPAACTLRYLNSIKKQIRPDDIVTVVGGGNMGDMYGDIELLRLLVVKEFKRSRIILFPQTIDYSDSQEAMWLKRLSQKIYPKAEKLTMCAREKMSYDMMRKLYPTVDVRLTPDIVMGLDERYPNARENVATFCIRNDKEKADNYSVLQLIKHQCEVQEIDIEHFDTHIGGDRYTEAEKYAELEKIWCQFRKSRMIVTDRLHGMIFAYITGTPAIVLPNSNFKVSACYEWIKDCGYIRMIKDKSIIPNLSDPTNRHDISESIRNSLQHIL